MISIITPVFQSERYLEKLINSILNQTYRDWELLLIDDGSTDGSAEICDRYAQKDKRIRVFHKANGGVASARNQAIEMSRGEFLAFADSDDWVEPDWLERLYTTAKEYDADIVVSDFYQEYSQNSVMRSKGDHSVDVLNREEALYLSFQDKIKSYLWAMIMRRDIAKERFGTYHAYEDYAIVFAWMVHASRVVLLHTPLYHYRQSVYSCLHNHMEQNNIDWFNASIERYELIKSANFLQDNISRFNVAYVRILVKGAKDLVRAPYSSEFKLNLLRLALSEIQRVHISSPYKMLGLKYFIRYRLLCKNLKLFKYFVEKTAIFSIQNRRNNDDLYS